MIKRVTDWLRRIFYTKPLCLHENSEFLYWIPEEHILVHFCRDCNETCLFEVTGRWQKGKEIKE